MKKPVLALLFFLISISSFSQTTSFGLNGGFGKAWNTNRYTYYESRDFNFATFGFSVLKTTESNFAFGADLNYSFEGARLYMQTRREIPSSLDMSARLQYLKVPLKVYYLFGKPFSAIRPKVYLAPTLGSLIYAYNKDTYMHSGGTNHLKQNTTSMYPRFDVGLQGGVGFNFNFPDGTILTTDLIYYNGFLNTWGGTRKNSNASLNVGVLWNIGKK